MTIIFTCSGRRNYLITYFKEILGDNGKTVALDSLYSAPSLQIADVGIVVPKITSKDYIPTLKNIIKEHKADAIIPLNDLELPLISKHKSSLEALGVKVFLSDEIMVNIILDKWKTYNFLKSFNINTPKTFLDIEDAISSIDAKEINFPLIVKPRWGSASIGIHTANNKEELNSVLQFLTLKQNTVVLTSLNETNETKFFIIQELIQGDEYGMDILNDLDGNFVNVFVRKKLAMRAGETDKAITVANKEFKSIANKLAEATRHIGILDCDFFISKNKVIIIEMNSRFGGGYPFMHLSGANVPAIYVSWLKGNNIISEFLNYKAGLTFSKCDNIVPIKK